MNCKQVSKLLYAFADGELETTENLEVLAHLKMCPDCCRKVDAQHQLKAGLVSALGRDKAPDALRKTVTAALAAEGEPRMVGRFRLTRRRYGIPLALAAAVALATAGILQFSGIGSPRVTDDSVVAAAFADRVYEMHHACELRGPARHNTDLPRDVQLAANQMTQELHVPVLRCQAFSNLSGTFESADYCDFPDAGGHKIHGAHIILRRDSGEAVSLISLPKLDEMQQLRTYQTDQRAYVILRPHHAPGTPDVTIAAWNCPKGTHIVCAPTDPGHILDLADPMRLAMKRASPAASPILASLPR
jgi:mycothiol system anti-sigma-R factor